MRLFALISIALILTIFLAGCPSEKPGESEDSLPPVPGAAMNAEDSGTGFSEGVMEVDEEAPDFILTDTAGEAITRADYLGKILVLDFWATWCAPCVEKLKKYEPIMEKYADKDVELVAVSLDSTPEVAAGWGKENNSPFRIVMMDEVFQAAYFPEVSGQVPVPQGRIIDKDGNLRYKFDSKSTVEDLDKALKALTEVAGNDAEAASSDKDNEEPVKTK